MHGGRGGGGYFLEPHNKLLPCHPGVSLCVTLILIATLLAIVLTLAGPNMQDRLRVEHRVNIPAILKKNSPLHNPRALTIRETKLWD